MWFLQLTAWIFEMPAVASHVTEPGWLLTEPGAVIKFRHFSTHPRAPTPVHVCYKALFVRVPWCMSVSLTRCGWENVTGIPGACGIRNCTYLVRGPLLLSPNEAAAKENHISQFLLKGHELSIWMITLEEFSRNWKTKQHKTKQK